MLEIEDEAIFKIHSDYSLSSMESKNSKFWLFELKEGNIYRLNDVSHTILSQLDGKNNSAAVIDAVANLFEGVSIDKIRQDGKEFLTLCLNKGIIYQAEENSK